MLLQRRVPPGYRPKNQQNGTNAVTTDLNSTDQGSFSSQASTSSIQLTPEDCKKLMSLLKGTKNEGYASSSSINRPTDIKDASSNHMISHITQSDNSFMNTTH